MNLSDYIHRLVYQWGSTFAIINPLAILTVVGNGRHLGLELDGLTKTVQEGYKEISPTIMET